MKVSSITVDGNLSDWANIASISMADDPGNGRGALNNSATVKLAWNDTYLYAAYNVTDTELLAVQTTRDHGDVYKDDGIELYIDPQGDGGAATSMTTTDYQFLANVRDALGDNRGTGSGSKDESFNAQSFLSKAITNGTLNATGVDIGHTVELRISWSDLGVTPAAGSFMRMDLAVNDRDGTASTTEEFDWADLTATYNNPSGWKDVQLVNPPPPVSAYDIVKVPAINLDGNLSDWAGVATISMADDPNNSRGALNNGAEVKLAWDDTYLYAAYDVTDTDLRSVQSARDHGDLYQDDGIELYIDPQGDGSAATSMTTTDYQLLANAQETVGDKRGNGTGGKDATFNAASLLAQVATNGTLNATGTDVGYALELRVAWADLGVAPAAGSFMRMDLAVDDRDGDPPPSTEEFDWANLTATYNNPSGWKNVKLAVDATPPPAPTNPTLTVVSSSQIDVSWTASTSTDVAKYNIYRATSGTPTLYQTVSGSPYQDTGLTPGTNYTYQIAALDAAGNESAKTAPTSATTSGSGGPLLRVGLGNFPPSEFGHGPGRDAGSPIYRQTGYNPSPSSIAADIALADQHDILIVANVASSRGNWTTSEGNYDPALYEQRVRRFTVAGGASAANAAALTDAVARRRVVFYVVDEPNLPTFNGSISPRDVNDMGLLHKSIWPGAITIVRAAGTTLTEGWPNDDGVSGPPPGGYTGLDYGWAARSGQHNGLTLQEYFTEQKSLLDFLDLGMVPGLNWWAGGLKAGQNIDGVTACWDVHNNGSSTGYIVGVGTNTSGLARGTKVNCGESLAGVSRVVASPAWIRRWADEVAADPDAPFVSIWTYPYNSFTELDWTMPLETRADYVSAMDYAINKGATRTNWTGWRTAK